MMRLITLELRQNRLKIYMLATLACIATILVLSYIFANTPNTQPSNEIEAMLMPLIATMFGNYENIITISSIIGMACFALLSSAAFSQLVVSDYMGKRVNLLFAYPIDRSKLFLSKVIIVFVFTIAAMIISSAIAFGIFFLTEPHFAIVAGDTLSAGLFIRTAQISLIFSVLAGGIGLISLWFGFKRKSIQATIIPAVIMATIGTNVLTSPMLMGSVSMVFLTVIAVGALVAGVLLTINLTRNVKYMEAE